MPREERRHKRSKGAIAGAAVLACCSLPLTAHGLETAKRSALPLEHRQDSNRTIPILITNNCADTMWPGIWTQFGGGPLEGGHELGPGEQAEHTVSTDWQGRVWARTNCSFNDEGTAGESATYEGNRACETGDCNGVLNCEITVRFWES